MENKLAFCSNTINQKWVLIIEVIFKDKKKENNICNFQKIRL